MICLERFDRAAERIGHARDLREFFRRQFVQIFVEWIAGIDPVLDPIEAGKQKRRKGEIGIRGGIGRAKLDSFRLGAGRIRGNADRGGTVAR